MDASKGFWAVWNLIVGVVVPLACVAGGAGGLMWAAGNEHEGKKRIRLALTGAVVVGIIPAAVKMAVDLGKSMSGGV